MSPTQTSCLSELNPLHFPHLQTLQKSNVRTRGSHVYVRIRTCRPLRVSLQPYRDTRSLPRTSSHMPEPPQQNAGMVPLRFSCAVAPDHRGCCCSHGRLFSTHTHTHTESERGRREWKERERERERLKKEQAQRNESRETETRGVAVRSLSLVCR